MKLLMIALAVLTATAGTGVRAQTVASPGGETSFDFALEDGVPKATVLRAGRVACEMTLGIVAEKYELVSVATQRIDRTWRPVWGVQAECADRCVELTVRLRRAGTQLPLAELQLRAYDEGFAVRAARDFSPYGLAEVKEEATRWRFPEGTRAWAIWSGEGTYPERPVEVGSLDPKRRWMMPLTVELPDGGCASILEADVQDYPRSRLMATAEGLKPVFAVGTKEGRDWFRSPWRVLLLAPDAAKLVERASLVQTLNPPCELKDTAWIRPGQCVSDQLNCELVTSEVIAAAKRAKGIGARYFQLDWGWYGTEAPWSVDQCETFRKAHPELAKELADGRWIANTRADPYATARGFVPYSAWWDLDCHRRNVDLDIPRIVAALKELDMGLCLYVNGTILATHDLDRLFAHYAKWGVAGLKPGFVSCGSQHAANDLRRLLRTAARHRLWLDVHDGYVPEGLERTFPNLMISEGGGGQEGRHPLRQDVTLPFARCLAGPFDYTPEFFESHRTPVHAAAMLLAYPGPTATLRGSVEKAVAEHPDVFGFVRALPWSYDETRVLSAKIGDHLVVARRKGDVWYVAGLTGASPRAFDLPLDFIGVESGSYRLWTDDGGETVLKGWSLKVSCAPGGGFCAIL